MNRMLGPFVCCLAVVGGIAFAIYGAIVIPVESRRPEVPTREVDDFVTRGDLQDFVTTVELKKLLEERQRPENFATTKQLRDLFGWVKSVVVQVESLSELVAALHEEIEIKDGEFGFKHVDPTRWVIIDATPK